VGSTIGAGSAVGPEVVDVEDAAGELVDELNAPSNGESSNTNRKKAMATCATLLKPRYLSQTFLIIGELPAVS
jgi:hypothetical protein